MLDQFFFGHPKNKEKHLYFGTPEKITHFLPSFTIPQKKLQILSPTNVRKLVQTIGNISGMVAQVARPRIQLVVFLVLAPRYIGQGFCFVKVVFLPFFELFFES